MFLDSLLKSFIDNRDGNAFFINNEYFTYGRLSNSVCSIKNQLIKFDLDCNENIGVVCSDDFITYSSILAIWFSGHAYVPLGIQNPTDRNIGILKNSNARIIISTIDLKVPEYSDYIILKPDIDQYHENRLSAPEFSNESLAYILFTSGSTGIPKGVPISFNNLNEFVNNFQNSPFKIKKEDRCLQMFELTFDVSISSFLIPLIAGACVFTVPNNVIKYVSILKLIHTYKITSIQIVPSIIKLGKSLLNKITFPDVKNCILTGEATYVDLFEVLIKSFPNAKVFNYYGPTEATIYCTYYLCKESTLKKYNGMLAIGKPMGEMILIVVDKDLNEIDHDQKGELLISGNQLTKGYLHNSKKSEEVFIDLTVDRMKRTFYRSGDLCYKDEEGDLFYCGRLDNQIKVQGFRVELNEIEITVRDRFGINNIVIPIENKSGSTELVLIMESVELGIKERVTEYLKTKLPVYMLPGKLFQMEKFPLVSSGKTDKKRMKEMVINGL